MKTVNKCFTVLMIAAVILIAFCISSTTSCQVAKENVVNSNIVNTHSTVLQDIIFEDGKPFYNGKPCVLDKGCCAIIISILEYGMDYPMIATFTEEYDDYCYMQVN